MEPEVPDNKPTKNNQEWYDEVYFDSDQDSEGEYEGGIGLMGQQKKTQINKPKKKVISNDELLYDPELDEKDEEWVSKQIDKDSSRTEDIPLDNKTDAILTCPMCFTTLCYSCQRHEKYANQFRAMFVRNCHTVPGEKYKIPGEKDESYFKVTCETCGIQVAMLDDDEIYHFFNVVATGR
ncbi:E2F-associated phosphoprotein [Helicostylum pulchrum]|nr:E2F-associated phosphoprotein [Helicostylum pulchrum]